MEKLYLQLYSLGKEMQNMPNALKKVSEIGYAGVEFAGSYYGDMNAVELKTMLDDLNLEALSSHVSLDKVENDVELVAAIGAKYMICPMGQFTNREEGLKIAEALNKAGELCKKHGLKYGYHNHTQEFAKDGDDYLLDILIQNTDPSLVVFQLDVGWTTAAGLNAPEYIKKNAGRFEMIHAKEAGKVIGVQPPIDFSKIKMGPEGLIIPPDIMKQIDEDRRMNYPQGTGVVNWKAIKSEADAQGAKAYVVEREWDYLDDIFACVKADYEFMKTV